MHFPSCGKQADSIKESKPVWSMPKADRDKAKKVFISGKHNQDLVGKDSPGHNYETRGVIKGGFSFGSSAQRPPPKGAQYPDTSGDRIGNMPNHLKFKYQTRSASIGTCPRSAQLSAPDMNTFVAGGISPGPQRYSTANAPYAVSHAHAPGITNSPPKYTMRSRTKIFQGGSPATGEKVGPGHYPVAESCNAQAESHKQSLPKWGICKSDRFPDKLHHDSYRLHDGHGEKKIQFNRMYNSTPAFSFGTSTRGHAKKIARTITDLDKGPVANMSPNRPEHPHLVPRHEILKFGSAMAG